MYTAEREKIILDCDPGTDDSVCIVMALTHPNVELLAITAESGNLTSDRTSKNALRVLEHLGRTDVPVAKGMSHPLVRPHPADPYSHGEDGLGNHFFPEPTTPLDERHAAQMIIDQVMKYPNEVSLVCTGPLTNVALAMMLKPEIVPNIKKIYHLGGSYGFNDGAYRCATGDTPMSEWNIFVDPEAARIVYSSGINLTSVSLDVAYGGKTNISDETLAKIKALDTPASRYVSEILEYIEEATSDSKGGFHFRGTIDTVAMCAFLCPDVIQKKEVRIAIDTSSSATRGMVIWDRRLWTKRNLSPWDEFFYVEAAYDIDPDLYQQTYYEALGGLTAGQKG